MRAMIAASRIMWPIWWQRLSPPLLQTLSSHFPFSVCLQPRRRAPRQSSPAWTASVSPGAGDATENPSVPTAPTRRRRPAVSPTIQLRDESSERCFQFASPSGSRFHSWVRAEDTTEWTNQPIQLHYLNQWFPTGGPWRTAEADINIKGCEKQATEIEKKYVSVMWN